MAELRTQSRHRGRQNVGTIPKKECKYKSSQTPEDLCFTRRIPFVSSLHCYGWVIKATRIETGLNMQK